MGIELVRAALVVGVSMAIGAPVSAQPPAPSDAGAPAAPSRAPEERWEGAVTLPNGGTLDIVVTLADRPEGMVGSMDIPAQGAAGVSLRDVEITAEVVRFTLAQPGLPKTTWAVFDLKRTAGEQGDTAEGTMTQSGLVMPVKLRRVALAEAAGSSSLRPQQPTPPFPYMAEDVQVVNPGDGTILVGTLTLPAGEGPHPAVVLITGSGAQDRNETLMGHQPFLVIADHLTRRGWAVLRLDDRGVGASTGNVDASTTLDFAMDALAGVELLRKRPDIDPGRVGLIGHSEGGAAAAMAAARSPSVAFIVSLAGTCQPGWEVTRWQAGVIARAGGRTEDRIARNAEIFDRLVAALKAEKERGEIEALIREAVVLEFEEAEEAAPGSALQAAERERLITILVQQRAMATLTPWMRSFMLVDPAADFERVRCPVLALNGELDLQVDPEGNLGAMRAALARGGNTDVEIVRLPGLNHLFQEAKTGHPSEYGQIRETFSPKALAVMTDWLEKRKAPAASPKAQD